jgi:hypothetical protein
MIRLDSVRLVLNVRQCTKRSLGQFTMLQRMGTSHIENRRLFELAEGRILLQDSERDHLHLCTVCQGVLYVLLNQPPMSSETPAEPDAA